MHDQDIYAGTRTAVDEPVTPARPPAEPVFAGPPEVVVERLPSGEPVAVPIAQTQPVVPAPRVGENAPSGAATGVADAAKEAAGTAKEEARNVAQAAKSEAGAVLDEAKGQVRRLAVQARDQAREGVRGQHSQLVDKLRQVADELGEMAGDGGSPARAVVSDLSQRGRRLAAYLADRGPEGVLAEVQDFARRRPAAFLAGAAVAGFLVGRVGKNVWKAQSEGTRSGAPVVVAAPVETDPYARPAVSSVGLPVSIESPAGAPMSGPYPASPYASETYPGADHPGGDRR
jgi:hypothetical protein